MSDQSKVFRATADDAGKRLDQFLVAHLPDISRARVQQLIAEQKVLIGGVASKASLRLLKEVLTIDEHSHPGRFRPALNERIAPAMAGHNRLKILRK